MAVTSLLQLVEQLLSDGDAAAQFRASPDGFLAEHGLDDLSGDDVVDALALGFESVHVDVAGRIVLPESSSGGSAADALRDLLDAAPSESVLAPDSADSADSTDADDAADLDLDFGLGDLFTTGGGESPVDLGADLDAGDDLDLGLGAEPEGDLDTATFDQGFGSGSGDLDVDQLHDVDDLHFGDHHDLDDGPDGLV